MNFADRISRCIQEFGPLVVGLDPHIEYLPRFILEQEFKEKGKTWEALALSLIHISFRFFDLPR